MSQTYRMSLRASRPSNPSNIAPQITVDSDTTKMPPMQPVRPPPLPHAAGHSSATTNSDSSASQIRNLSVDHPEYVPPLLAGIRIHLLPTKLDVALPEYSRKVLTLGGNLVPLPPKPTDKPAHPDTTALPLDYPHVVLTTLKGRPRLSRLLKGTLVDTLDVINVAWIDEVWKTGQDWVWGRPISVGLGGMRDQHDDRAAPVTQLDTDFARMQDSLFPLPRLPDRQPFRIPHTSLTVLARIRNRDSLAVCEASDIAICVKETLSRERQQNDMEFNGRKRRRGDDIHHQEHRDSEKRTKTDGATRNSRSAAILPGLVRGFSKVMAETNSGIPGYLAHLQRDDSLSRNDTLLVEPTDEQVTHDHANPVICGEDETDPTNILVRPYGRMGRKSSVHVEHPKQDTQVLSASKERQAAQEVDIVEGVRTLRPLPFDVELEDVPSSSIKRCSPLICVNDDIINAIRPIYLKREFDAPAEKNANTLSYKRSMSILKAVPRRIKSGSEALQLSGCGNKVADRITEYLETGRIEESDNILADPRFRTLREFASVFTIGNSTAVELYDIHGCRSLSDVADYYAEKEGQEWDSGIVGEGVPLAKRKVRYGNDGVVGARGGTYRWKRKTRDAVLRRQQGMMSRAEICREWMLIQDELDERIPRAEVKEISECVESHLDAILPGCHCTLTGGYRRGKLDSGDIDLVICPPGPGLDTGLLKSLRDRMTAQGVITHVLRSFKESTRRGLYY